MHADENVPSHPLHPYILYKHHKKYPGATSGSMTRKSLQLSIRKITSIFGNCSYAVTRFWRAAAQERRWLNNGISCASSVSQLLLLTFIRITGILAWLKNSVPLVSFCIWSSRRSKPSSFETPLFINILSLGYNMATCQDSPFLV